MTSETRSRPTQGFKFGILVITLVLAGLGVRYVLLPLPGELLARDDALQPGADGIIVLMGILDDYRARAALEAYKAGDAPKILMAHSIIYGFEREGLMPAEVEIYRKYFEKYGVPAQDIMIAEDCRASSTHDEAVCIEKLVRQALPHAKRLIIATSWYHSSRAGWTFEHVFADTGIKFAVKAAEVRGADPAHWWRSHPGILGVYTEALKWAYWYGKWLTGQL